MKGDITINVIISGLFAVGIAAFGIYFFFKILQEIQTLNIQSQTERDAMHLANALISSERLIYEKDGVRYRGILNASKLSEVFYRPNEDDEEKKEYFKKIFDSKYWITSEKLELSYPNAISLILIVDLDDCNQEKCVMWGGIIVDLNENIILKSPLVKLADCLLRDFDKTWGHVEKIFISCGGTATIGAAVGVWVFGVGAPIGAAIGCGIGIMGAFWTPDEISNCIKRSTPEFEKQFFESGSPISQRGVPVNIAYDDGNVHKGRLMVALLELV